MIKNYKKIIKVIGFDFDQTLYPKSPEIDSVIQIYIYKKIAKHKKCDLMQAEKLFKDLYRDGNGLSGSKTLLALGILNGKDIVQEALENADINKFLKPDPRIAEFLDLTKKQYKNIDIITGSKMSNVILKLKKINIKESIFNNIFDASRASKSDGSAFRVWMNFYPSYTPQNFLYIGDRVSSDHLIPKKLGIQTILVNIKNTDPQLKCLQLKSLEELRKYLF